ncbi:MAG: hypothetical protein DWI59_06210 [Chloroflexi bacterium]|nr:MAG: hypothetical protein DWI59_06210 [Chloroflexota bacterium]
MASLDDILSTQKNGVVSINQIGQIFQRYIGTLTSGAVAADTLVVIGKGRLVNFSITVAGSTDGMIHNASRIAGASASNAMVAIPKPGASADSPHPGVGVFPVNAVFDSGLVIIIGAGQQVSVTYSLGQP